MGTDVAEVVETPLNPSNVKVHRVMCTTLLNFVDGISKLIPDIEAAQPRCSSGIESLCLLRNAIKKARLLVQYCSESSKLYLAITGDAIVSRCRRTRSLLEQSLGQLQTMVPVALELEISQIVEDLRYAVFVMDSAEEEAGQVMRALLQKDKSRSDSAENSEIEALQFASSRLRLLSWKDLLIEKRSIKKLLNTVTDSDLTKMMILKYLLYLLKKHDKVIVRDQTENPVVLNNGSFLAANSHEESVESRVLHEESQLEYELDGAQRDMLRGPILPEEFKCPLSSRLMYDPVVIASGQTFERIYIQKWFNEGNDTCPITRMKLAHFSLTPNSVIRDLISKWGSEHGITAFDPSIQSSVFGSSETSSCSITSTSSSLKGLHLHIDLSDLSLGSIDSAHSLDISYGSNLIKPQTSHRFRYFSSTDEVENRFLSNIGAVAWESQCMAIQDVENYLKFCAHARIYVSDDNFVEPLFRFLRDSFEMRDVKAQKAGVQLFSTYLSTIRDAVPYVSGDMYTLLASFLETEAAEETLSVLESLSVNDNFGSKHAVLTAILKTLNAENRCFRGSAIKILYNLTSNVDLSSNTLLLECIPKLVPFLSDSSLAGNCIVILENLCDIEGAKATIAETKGCIASIAELLDAGSREDQEHAASVLLYLCSQGIRYCQLVMDEGIIPALVSVSVNGNDRGKVVALELLRLLRDIGYEEQRCSGLDVIASDDSCRPSEEKKMSSNLYRPSEEKKMASKRTGFVGGKMGFFSRKKK